jgi:hypothetical protein
MRRSKMWNISGAFLATLVALAAAGCYTQLRTRGYDYESRREPPHAGVAAEELIVRTDRPWYEKSLTEDYVTIGARLDNNGDASILLSGCPEPPAAVIEEWAGDEWVEGSAVGFACFGVHSLKKAEVPPGDCFEFELHLGDPGWYRLRLSVGPDPRRPEATVYSNEFLIR